MSKKSAAYYVAREIKTEIEFDIENIPDDAIKDPAKTFMPDILAFYESEEERKEFEDWKKNKTIS